MYTFLALAAEISLGSMKRVAPINQPPLLSRVGSKTSAIQDDCGHQITGLANRQPDGGISASRLVGARLGAITASNFAGIRLNLEA